MAAVKKIGGLSVIIPDVAFDSNTLLLAHMNGINDSTSFYDYSKYKRPLTAVNNAKISTAQSKFGGASAYFDGDGDYISVPSSSDFNFGTGDFTIEMWTYPLSVEVQQSLLSGLSSGNLFFQWSPLYGFGIGKVATSWDTYYSYSLAANTWTHLAAVRSSGTVYLFANGTLISSASNTNNYTLGDGIRIGAETSGNNTYGYEDELRISNVARQTSGFTPLAYPYAA